MELHYGALITFTQNGGDTTDVSVWPEQERTKRILI